MSSGVIKTNQPLKSGQGLPPPTTQNILLDKINPRRATPDSTLETAVASSDEEATQDLSQSVHNQKPPRRASWLIEPTQIGYRPRKDSFASSSMSPTTSHPGTPSVETNAVTWASTSSTIMSRPHASPASLGWGSSSGIWNNPQGPPSRLSEVLPSPTSPAPNSSFNSQGIPFSIPIHPTPKNYRSQSYSVGQLDPDTSIPTTTPGPSSMMGSSRSRGLPHQGLQHRPSRPSMLSEMSNEGGMLGKVKEVEDDDTAYAEAMAQAKSADAKKIEMLSRENAMLRQQQLNASRMRPRASSGYVGGGLGNGYGLRESVPEESSDFAVEDEVNDPEAASRRGFTRRMSEYGNSPFRSSFTLESRPTLENRPLENVKKAIWSTSPGFSLADQPQSRRHSFADAPTRQPSVGPIGEQPLSQEPGYVDGQQGQNFTAAQIENAMLAAQMNPANYYNGSGMAGAQNPVMPPSYGTMYQSMFAMQTPFSVNRPPSPHRGGLYGMPQARHAQKLHVVLFKCNRADVFYIQEDTGLTVKAGDLVIVEADRGYDLGTVSRENVDWATAKELKEHYAEEHYKWLMMFSQNAAAAQDGTGAGLMAASNGMHGGAVGGMGPPSHNHMQEPNNGELKPKLIRRLAQPHEVQALRDKEGNEAKAKRVCQSKVKDHGLNMEILDAEFQVDWKKLTFYYFADSYINFNNLVTDLFKIYKTRIWMSAINPASFASPSIGQTPSGVGPGAVGVGRNAPNDRRQNPQHQQLDTQSAYAPNSVVAARPFSGGLGSPSFGNDRGATPFSQPQTYPYTYGTGFNNAASRPVGSTFIPNADPYATAFPSADYTQQQQQRSRVGFPPPQSSAPSQHEQPISPLTAQNDWTSPFQGLSLNGR